jgi:methylmalonyl-CoA mutase N-terminal domain/subunit
MGGMIPAIERGFPQAEIAEASFRFQREVEEGKRVIVGVNAYVQEEEQPIEILQVDRAAEEAQVRKLRELRARRDGAAVEAGLNALRRAAAGNANLMPAILDCVRAYATLGEMCGALRGQFGVWVERAAI